VALSCQVTRKLKRATTVDFTTISAIIFIHCWQLYFLDSKAVFCQNIFNSHDQAGCG